MRVAGVKIAHFRGIENCEFSLYGSSVCRAAFSRKVSIAVLAFLSNRSFRKM